MTRRFVVIKPFTDLQDEKHVYSAGDFYPREGTELNEIRAEDLANGHNVRNEQLIVEVMVKEAPKQDSEGEFPKHLGGGHYELSNGEKVQGKEKAIEAERVLKQEGD